MSIKKIFGTIVLVISLITGVWLIDDRYISASELTQAKNQIYLKMDTAEYRYLTEQYYKFKELLKKDPNDTDLKQQFEEIKKEREEVKRKIDKLLRNGE